MKLVAVAPIVVCVLAGCALPERSATGRYTTDQPARAVALGLEQMARQCWERNWGWFSGDGVRIETRTTIQGAYAIQAQRFEPDSGLKPPFAEIIVTDEGAGSGVVLFETGHNPFGWRQRSLGPEVRSWLDGSRSCLTAK